MGQFSSVVAASIIRSMEALGLRGGPTILRLIYAVGLGRVSTSLVELRSGRSIRFPTFDHYWARYLWGGAIYEPDVQWIFDCLASIPNKLFVDCGANIGYWTIQVSEPRYNFSGFAAVEANPAMITFLRQNVELNGIEAKVVHAAIAEHSGRSVTIGNTYHHAIASIGEEGIPVTTISLVDLLASYELRDRLTVIKLDVEGSEIAAIRGAPTPSKWHPVYVFEDWPSQGMRVTKYLLEQGFAVLGVAPGLEPEYIESATQAQSFNRRTAPPNGPSNLIGCRKRAVDQLMSEFSRAAGCARAAEDDGRVDCLTSASEPLFSLREGQRIIGT